jgi:hypothetical protein
VSIFKRRPTRLGRQLALGELEDAMGAAERAVPAGTLIYTASGRVAHVKSAIHPGALCPAMREWTDWLGTGSDEERDRAASLPSCPRCAACISASGAAS